MNPNNFKKFLFLIFTISSLSGCREESPKKVEEPIENNSTVAPYKTRRQVFEESLDKIKKELYSEKYPEIQNKFNVLKPQIFISYAWEPAIKLWVDEVLSKDLERLGFDVLYDQERITPGRKISKFEAEVQHATYVIMVCTPKYLQRYKEHTAAQSTGVGREIEKILQRPKKKGIILPIYLKGNFDECVPDIVKLRKIAAFCAEGEDDYYQTIFKIAQSLFLFDNLNAQPIKQVRDEFFAYKSK